MAAPPPHLVTRLQRRTPQPVMEVDKNEWLDKPLDERIKAGRRQSDRSSYRRSRDVPMKDVESGHVPGRPSFSITVDNSDAPGRTVGGKMRRNRKTDRATPYKPFHARRNKRSAVIDAEESGGWKHDLYTGPKVKELSTSKFKNAELSTSSVVTISNIPWQVDSDDLDELFSSIKFFDKVEVVFDRSGRSEGVALVHFSKRAAARDFASEYDGVKLDGQRMKVEVGDLSSERSASASTKPSSPVGEVKARGRAKPRYEPSKQKQQAQRSGRVLVKH